MNKEQVLQKYFGYKTFREPQGLLIDKILAGQDVLAILPTGFGKSLIFQVAGLCLAGITLVISPLVALMKDQVDSLQVRGIKAAYIASTLNQGEIQAILNNLEEYKFIYVAAERLVNPFFLSKIQNISLIVIDEVHTIDWGLDFRQDILKIGDFCKNYQVPIACFSATISYQTLHHIKKYIRLNKPFIFRSSPLRENIKVQVVNKANYATLLAIIRKFPQCKIIIYTLTCKTANHLYEQLRSDFQVAKYHGQLLKDEKIHFQNLFKGETNIMIATNAYGMGLDIPNVRAVILYELPLTLGDLVQQIGRGGRDKNLAYAYIFNNQRNIDLCLKMINHSQNSYLKLVEFKYVLRYLKSRFKNRLICSYLLN